MHSPTHWRPARTSSSSQHRSRRFPDSCVRGQAGALPPYQLRAQRGALAVGSESSNRLCGMRSPDPGARAASLAPLGRSCVYSRRKRRFPSTVKWKHPAWKSYWIMACLREMFMLLPLKLGTTLTNVTNACVCGQTAEGRYSLPTKWCTYRDNKDCPGKRPLPPGKEAVQQTGLLDAQPMRTA